MIAGSLRVPLPSWVGTGVCADGEPAREAVAHRRAAVGDHALERAGDRAAVRRRRDDLLRVVRERHEPEAEVVGRLVEQHLGRLDGRGQPVGLDVLGAHRARDVVDEHHRRGPLRRGDAALRPRDGEDQRRGGEQQQRGGHVPAPAGPPGDEAGQQRRVAERGGLAPAPALDRRVREHAPRAAARGRAGRRARGTSPARRLLRRRGVLGGRRRPARAAAAAGRSRRARASGRRGAGGAARSCSQSPSVESTRWSAPARRRAAATSARSAAAAALKRAAHLAPARVDDDLAARLRGRPSTRRRPPAARARAGRAPRPPARRGARAGERSAALPVARAAEVRHDHDEPARAGERGHAGRSRRRATSRPRRRRAGSARSSASRPSSPSRPWRGRSTRGSRPAERDDAEPVAAPRGDVADRRGSRPPPRRPCAAARCRSAIDGETSSISQAVIARSPTCTRTCGSRIRAVTFQSM